MSSFCAPGRSAQVVYSERTSCYCALHQADAADLFGAGNRRHFCRALRLGRKTAGEVYVGWMGDLGIDFFFLIVAKTHVLFFRVFLLFPRISLGVNKSSLARPHKNISKTKEDLVVCFFSAPTRCQGEQSLSAGVLELSKVFAESLGLEEGEVVEATA